MKGQHGLPDPSSPSPSYAVSGEFLTSSPSPILSSPPEQAKTDGVNSYSAAILIWRGSVRTKKTISVEEKLRSALQLPVAIAMPRTQDGTVLTGQHKAPTPASHNSSPDHRSDGDVDEDGETDESVKRDNEHLDSDPLSATTTFPRSPRRTTVAFGSTGEKVVDDRQRAASVTAPGHTPPALDENIKLAPPLPQTEAKGGYHL